ncbi:MAG: winged helix-turn-helix domain-containing protein [archaeon]|nr:winged helix-turn-helix domain-containing protein [archaeon]
MVKDDIREMMDEIDELIESTLETAGKPVSTYQLAKDTGLSWSTVNAHCYKMKSMGIVDGKFEVARIGQRKKLLWWVEKGNK